MTARTFHDLHAVEQEAELWMRQSITEHLARYRAVGCEVSMMHDEYVIDRPKNFAELSSEQQWAIDKALGQLDSEEVRPVSMQADARPGALHVRTMVRRVLTPDPLPPASFTHDCNQCVRFATNAVGDWYTCPNLILGGRTLICRFSDKGGDYAAMPIIHAGGVASGFLIGGLLAGLRLTDDESREITAALLRLHTFNSPEHLQALFRYTDHATMDIENFAKIGDLIHAAVTERP